MPFITSCIHRATERGWVVVHFDDGPCIRLRRDVFEETPYKEGMELSDGQVETLIARSQWEHARSVAFRYLNSRPRTVREMSTRLSNEDLPMESIQGVISDLIDKGHLDDEQFAKMWVETRANSRPKGRRAIAEELSKRGVCRPRIERIIGSHYPEEMKLARKVACGRAKSLGDTDEATFRRRLAGYLVRRGFDSQEVMPLVDELWGEFGGSEAVS